jgi:hypothetical protein
MMTYLLDTSVYCQPIKRKPLKCVMDRWNLLGDDVLCTRFFVKQKSFKD